MWSGDTKIESVWGCEILGDFGNAAATNEQEAQQGACSGFVRKLIGYFRPRHRPVVVIPCAVVISP